jgi:hypothetical protein
MRQKSILELYRKYTEFFHHFVPCHNCSQVRRNLDPFSDRTRTCSEPATGPLRPEPQSCPALSIGPLSSPQIFDWIRPGLR